MIGKWDGNSLWLESEDFSKTRARLEGNFHRLLSQRLLLEQCLTASVPLPAPPSESITGSSGSSSSEDNSASLCNTTSVSSIVGSDNTTLRTAIDDAATSKSTLPTETWSSSFYAEFWRETSQQRLSYVEEKNLACKRRRNILKNYFCTKTTNCTVQWQPKPRSRTKTKATGTEKIPRLNFIVISILYNCAEEYTFCNVKHCSAEVEWIASIRKWQPIAARKKLS